MEKLTVTPTPIELAQKVNEAVQELDDFKRETIKKSGDTMVGALKVPTPVAAEDAAN